FKKDEEMATPGYYRVKLEDYGITAELTATKRVGFQKYTFPESTDSYLLFDIGNQLGESGKVKDAYVNFNEDNTIEGWVITYPEYVKKYQPEGEIRMYFSGVVDKAPREVGTFRGEEIFTNTNEQTGIGAGLYLKYD